jgi:hypothetical protein
MKVVHIESGLGNQMLSFAEYLVIKKLNPSEECYIENLIYEIPECNDVIFQWYGYELERIFGIRAPNIKDKFSKEQWYTILTQIKKTEFWKNGWKYAPAITKVFCDNGVPLINYLGNDAKYVPHKPNKLLDNKLVYDIKRWTRPLYSKQYIKKMDTSNLIFIKNSKNIFTGQTLGLRNQGVDIGFVFKEIKDAFQFPPIVDKENTEILKIIKNSEAVAIHARRGDMLQSNGYCYKYGYFKRATNYVKKRVISPVFFFFCDTESVQWCKNNFDIFGLDKNIDQIYFVDWNTGKEYYRDMQLMAECKHNIITNSSFGWWGAFLNSNPKKITCSPNIWINTTVHL